MQSAISLGGGTLASALYLGVLGGYAMLWVQPVAMLMGVIMLGSIAYITLSIERSPFQAMRQDIDPVLAWGWLLASLMANIVWAMPQYALAYGALTENLFPAAFSALTEDGQPVKELVSVRLGVSIAILVVVGLISLSYGKQSLGFKIYEAVLKAMVALIVLAFMGVVAKLMIQGRFDWGSAFAGFIPNLSHLTQPTEFFQQQLDAIANPETRDYWHAVVLAKQREVMVGAAAAAVGINMTFLMPFALLAKKWGRAMRGFAVVDLFGGMFFPFILAASCVVIAAATQFHGEVFEGIEIREDASFVATTPAAEQRLPQMQASIDQRLQALPELPLGVNEVRLAGMVLPRDNFELALSLERLQGSDLFTQLVFGVGVLAVAVSSITMMMVISGFCVCEALGAPHGGLTHRLGTLVAAPGALWPLLWAGQSKAYLGVVASTVGYTLIPIAFLGFFLMMNSKKILGKYRPEGTARILTNTAIIVSLAITGLASAWTAWQKSLFGFPIGRWAWAIFLALLAISFAARRLRRKPEVESSE